MDFHTPVLSDEVLEYLNPKPGETAVDGTLGGAGHALEIAKRIEPDGTLVGIDLDSAAIDQAKKVFEKQKLKSKIFFAQDNYKNIDRVLENLAIKKADLILVDIGISSFDLEQSKRGFSFQKEEPLDMRFNTEDRLENKRKQPFTAYFILQSYPEKELEKIFREYGEEKFSRKISRVIVRHRQQTEILTTTDLLELIKQALPAPLRFKAADSARRIFQSLRIEVNAELENLKEFLPKAFRLLTPGGRLAVISFHSLEDRIVKQFFNDRAKGCICPPEFPICKCGRDAQAKILTKKPISAGSKEQEQNPRSKPAKLRVLQKF